MVEFVSQQIRADLLGEHDECLQHGERHATVLAIATCERIARYIGVIWFQVPDLKWAGFGDGVGGASLILHCRKRRLDFQVSATGNNVMAHRINEHMRATSEWVGIDESGRLATWVCDAP